MDSFWKFIALCLIGLFKSDRCEYCIRQVFIGFLASISIFIPAVHAGPEGGNVVGGSGSINQSGLTTNVNQLSQSMAIDWQSYNLNGNEMVNYIQPNSNSISLNNIFGGSASQIHGQINANGQVILVNPNGIFFGENASINVGGLIASGLYIDPVDFMNGDYFFNEIEGTDGTVINSGLINASLGGNVALIGKQVKNEGIISAKLGSVNLSSGKAAVLTFDQQGLIGVRVKEEMLQEELGIDPAVLNSGKINAEGGRVLLSASVSRDIFSEAVNHDGIEQATVVAVHDDGSFTLGGAELLNSGSVDVSAEGNNEAGEVVMLGGNVTHSGTIKADSQQGQAGYIELHAADTTQLTGNAVISAQAAESGRGGDLKLLGDKVGLFDQSVVSANGANGGGQIFIGGGKQGMNPHIPNADFIYLGENTDVEASATDQGDGGSIIAFANDTARFYGDLIASGGVNGGDGGFIETSGKKGFEINTAPDVSAPAGDGGLWLVDPYNISIVDVVENGNYDTTGSTVYTSNLDGATINVGTITTGLGNGDVEIVTGIPGFGDPVSIESGDIIFFADLNYSGSINRTLTLSATNNINTNQRTIESSGIGQLNLVFNADTDSISGGDVFLANSDIDTNNGSFDASGVNFVSTRTDAGRTLTTLGGSVTLTFTGAINIGAEIITGDGTIDGVANAGDFTVVSATSFTNNNANGGISTQGSNAGNINITTTTGDVILGDLVLNSDANGGDITINSGNNINLEQAYDFDDTFGNNFVNTLTFNADNDIIINAEIFDSGGGAIDTMDVVFSADQDVSGAGDINIASSIYTAGGNFTASSVNFNSAQIVNTDASNSSGANSSSTDGSVTITTTGGTVTLGDVITEADAGSGNLNVTSGGGAITQTGSTVVTGATTLNSGTGDITLNNAANDFNGGVSITTANNVTLVDTNAIALGTSNIDGNLNVIAGDNITDTGALTVIGTTTLESTGNNDDIILDEAGHNLQGAITVTTTGGTTANVRIDNDAITTLINGATVDGDLVINADQNLTIGGVLTVDDDFVISIDGSSDSIVNINSNISSGGVTSITGGTGADTFNISADVNGVIDGIAGDDTFNLNAAALTVSDLKGGDDTDTLNGFDGTNTWDITNIAEGAVGSVNFVEIEAVNGGTGEDTLNGPTGDVTWTLGALGNANSGGNDWLASGFTAFEHFVGQGGVDTFNLLAAGSFTSIDGGGNTDVLDASASAVDSFNLGSELISVEDITGNDAGTSALIGAIGDNDWTITGVNQGEVINGSTVAFSGFNNVTGSSGDDLFQFDAGGSIGGTIDAGAEVNGDAVDYSNLGDVSITLADAFNGVINAEIIEAGGDAGNTTVTTLVGDNIDTGWIIDGTNTGTVNSVRFVGFNNLTGGSGDDTFTLDGGDITGTIDAGGHILGDIVNYSANATVNISLNSGSLFSGVINAETIQGNNSDSTLVGDDFNTTWVINDINEGTVSWNDGSANIVSFIDFNKLTGGSADDSFVYSGAGTITDTIDGGAHITGDSLNQSALVTANINIDNLTNIEQVIGNNFDSSLTGGASNSNWSITGTNSGSVNGISFIDFNNLIGGGGDDNFSFSPGGSVTGTIDGGAQAIADTLDYSALATVAVNIDSLINIEQVVGNNTTSTLTGGIGNNSWSITGANSGVVSTISFVDFNHLTGGSGDDSFSFTPTGSISGIIDGGAQVIEDSIDFSALTVVDVDLNNNGFLNFERYVGNDTNSTLTATNLANTWNITSNNDGDINGNIRFENFNNLAGGNADDNFVFATAALVTGSIDGGSGSVDTIDQSAVSSVSINLGDSSISNIERLVGNNVDSRLTGADDSNVWTITAGNGGNVDGIIFTNFNNLTGGTADDQYIIGAVGSISGAIDGGGQVNEDVVNLTALATVDVNIGDGSYVDIERFVGNNTNSSLTGADVINTWGITGDNGGSINGINFENFNQLIGGILTDNFNVSATGSLSGEANGGAGNDSATITLSGVENGDFDFVGGANNDSLNINGGHVDYLAEYQSDNGSGFEQFNISRGGNSYNINYNQTENIDANLILDELRVNGTSGNDTIDLGTNQFAVNSLSVINHSGNNNLSIDGLAGNDSVTNTNSTAVTASVLSISNVGIVGTSADAFNTNIAELQLNNVIGDVFIDELNQISLGALSASGSLTLSNQSGDIDDNAVLNTAGALTLTAQDGNILLNDDHQLSGALTLVANNGDITLKNTEGTLIAGASAETLNIVSDGDITQSGSVNTTTGTILSSVQDILLNDNNNQLVQLGISTARNVDISNNGNLGLNLLDVDNQLSLNATALTDNNGDTLNLSSRQLILNTDNGIGDGNSIEINTDQLTADNQLNGNVSLEQSGGDIQLITLRNTGSSGDITLGADRNILFHPGSTIAVLGTGDLLMRTDRGSYLGLGLANINNPDITAQNATFVGPLGVFGSRSRPLTLNVPGNVTIFTRGVFDPIFVVEPASYDPGESINFNTIGNASTELIEVETLSDIDPAIFTDLRNFSHEEVAIRLPRDQLFEDELEALKGNDEL